MVFSCHTGYLSLSMQIFKSKNCGKTLSQYTYIKSPIFRIITLDQVNQVCLCVCVLFAQWKCTRATDASIQTIDSNSVIGTVNGADRDASNNWSVWIIHKSNQQIGVRFIASIANDVRCVPINNCGKTRPNSLFQNRLMCWSAWIECMRFSNK